MSFLDEAEPGRLDIETIRSSVSCLFLAELLDLEVGDNDKTACWSHAEQTPSLHLYDDHFHCFGCGTGGDVIDMYAQLRDVNFARALRDLSKLAIGSDLEPGEVKARVKPPLPDFTTQLEARRVGPVFPDTLSDLGRHSAFIKERWPGINPAITLHQWMVPADIGFLIPHSHDGRVVGVKVRTFDGGKSAWTGSVFTTQLYEARIAKAPGIGTYLDKAVICEGESDAWAMASRTNDIDVFALPSGAGCWKEEWIEQQLGQYTRIWVCTDNDRAGSEALNKICNSVGYERAIPLAVPQLYVDVNEAMGKSQWRPEFKVQ